MANTRELFANNAQSTLAGAISNVSLALNLASGTGALFPNPNNANGEFFRLSLTDSSTGLNHEIVYVTARTGDTCTIVRGQEGTIAQGWLSGDIAANQNTAGAMQNMVQAWQAQAGATNYDATDSGTANSYAIQLVPAMPVPSDGVIVRFKVANTNTGASTLAVDGGTPAAIVGLSGSALQGGELVATGIAVLQYNGTTSNWALLSCSLSALSVGAALASRHAVQFGQVAEVVGSVRNLIANVTAASASMTITADQVTVMSALNGLAYGLASFSQTINLATTGAGGMDTGSPPNNGWVGVYAIYNPVANTRSTVAVNAGAGVIGEVYGGANMPAGFTASALVAVRRTNGSGQFAVSYQQNRTVEPVFTGVLTSGAVTTYTAVSLTSAVPPNAKYCGFTYGMTTASASNGVSLISADTTNEIGLRRAISPVITAVLGGAWANVRLITPQSVLYKNDPAGGTLSLNVVQYQF